MAEFVKNHGSSVKQDWKRVNEFYLLSRCWGSFVFPEPLRFHESKVFYQRIENLESWQDMLQSAPAEARFLRIGAALAEIHGQKQEPDSDRVALHSDFGLINLAWDRDNDLPVIFDPLPSDFYPYKDFFGSRYFDLGQFVSTCFAPRHFWFFCRKSRIGIANVVKAFFKGYRQKSGLETDVKTVKKFAVLTFRRYLLLRIKDTPWLFWPMLAIIAWLLQKKMERTLECLTIANAT